MLDCDSHKKCVSFTVKQVEEICAEKNINLTDLRKRILKVIFKDHKAVKAYDVLKELRKNNISDKPPTIYRALDFFIKNKIIHKIHSLNSYIVCSHLGKHSDCHFLICTNCNKIEECCNENLKSSIKESAQNKDFTIENSNVEIIGICKNCQS